ncbi:MAG: class I SAM-dependent RNA methyltransferase [Planctomycetes bacterium]|nr:class I SAM-dependent RNA methyltransferase [Planctomycetota bacterium]
MPTNRARPDRPTADAASSGLSCPHFGACGGCSRLDQPIERQLADKQARAVELCGAWLSGVTPEVAQPPRPPRHDRTTMLYPVQRRGRRVVTGIYRRSTHDVEPITDCRIQHRALTEFGLRMADALPRLDVEPYDEAKLGGDLRALRARVMPGSGELLVGAVVTSLRFAARDKLVDALRRAGSQLKDDQGKALDLVGVVLNVNAEAGNKLLGPESHALVGRDHQFDRVAGPQGELTLRVSFGSFYQLHRRADAVLFKPAMAMLGDVRGLRVVDGYGGVGTFALRLLRDGAAHVTLVESAESSCADARANFAANHFYQDRAAVREEPFGSRPLPPCDVLVVDPPRAGLMGVGADAVLASDAERVLLVSCALESLARDLPLLESRYRVEAMRLCDLFPHTDHVEALTLLRRR